jgi:hypothetical protein
VRASNFALTSCPPPRQPMIRELNPPSLSIQALISFFPPANCRQCKLPVPLWSSDPKLANAYVSGRCAIGIKRRLPMNPDYHHVTNAIHFSFLPPCSEMDMQELLVFVCMLPVSTASLTTKISIPLLLFTSIYWRPRNRSAPQPRLQL